jgi:hypothetical protein
MALQAIGQQLRALREKSASLVAEALRDIENAFANTYRDMGWFLFQEKVSGIRQDVLQTPRLMIISDRNQNPIGEIRNIDGRLVILLDASSGQGILNIESKNRNTGESMQITPNTINITDIDGELLFAISASQDGSGNDSIQVLGQADNGALNSYSLSANPSEVSLVNTFKDAVDGDTLTTVKSEEAAATISAKKGADNEISSVVDAAAVVLSVKNDSATTTIKPESVATDRLGVGVSPPATDGYANIGVFLGVNAGSPSGAESVKVNGDTNLVGALDVSGAITNPLLTGEFVITLPGGTLTSEDAASHRTNLDVYAKSEVYTKAEVDAAIAAAIAAIVVDAVGDHDHGGMVPADGGHSHSLS